MIPDDKRPQPPLFTLHIKDLAISAKARAVLEESAQEMTDKADSLGYLDPLDEELCLIFDPRR